jgi:ABC-2 type transport system permease protein
VALDRYFLSAFLVRQFSVVWVVYAFEEDALQGRLSPYLLQPLHPLWRYVAAHLGEQLTRLPFAALIAAVFFAVQPQAFWLPSFGGFLLAWLAIWMAFAIAFLFQSLIAALCFWSEKASALERLQFIPFLFLSGLLAPLTAFPPAVRAWAQWTPFPYLIDFPARVLAGQPVDLLAGFGAQLAWIALLLPLVLLLWRAGVRRYSAMGA